MVIHLLEQSPSHAVRVTAPFTQGGLCCGATGETILDKSRASPVDCCPCPARRARHLGFRPFPGENANESLSAYQFPESKDSGGFFISGTRTNKCSSPVDCAVCRKSHLALPEGEPRRFAQNGFSDSFKCPLQKMQRALDFFRYSAGITGTGYPRSACRRSRRRRGCWRCSWLHIPSHPPAEA